MEARHRSAVNSDDSSKGRHQRHRDAEEVDKFKGPIPERKSCCNYRLLKLLLLVLTSGMFLALMFSPVDYYTHFTRSASRVIGVRWLQEKPVSDFRYASDLNINWTQITTATAKLNARKGTSKVGLINFNAAEVNYWQQLRLAAEFHVLNLDYAKFNFTWQDMFPEWIDEEEESDVPTCPSLPYPAIPGGTQFDLIAVKLPCNRTAKNWSRDVARLHLQLTAAKLAAQSGDSKFQAYVLLITQCFPIPNLFSCKNLVVREGNAWLYSTDPQILREKLQLPVGSCKLAVPLRKDAALRPYSAPRGHREAYATILHSAQDYVCGAITAAQSIRLSGSSRDLVILVDETITSNHRNGLEAAGWKVRTIQRIRNPKAEKDAYNEWNYSKFRLWQLSDYDKVIFIDADLLILRNIDFLFTMPEITAIGNNATLFNSGVMVIEPSNCTFQLLMDYVNEIESYNGGDQGYLNEIFTWWHRIPKHMNFLKHFWVGDAEEVKQKKIRLFGANPPVLYVLHYLGLKPWLCFRDYDCNWNVDFLQEFASDVAHATWWRVHDTMPKDLQSYCLLRSKQKAGLEWDRRQAEKAKYPDGHWRRNITDPRLHICFEKFCFWESMLWHWGEKNWTKSSPPAATKPTRMAKLPRAKCRGKCGVKKGEKKKFSSEKKSTT